MTSMLNQPTYDPYHPSHVVNALLLHAHTVHIGLPLMKLQRLLYLLYADYLKTTGKPLFGERFQTWMYGPALGSVYNVFKGYKTRPISRFWIDIADKCVYAVDLDRDPVFKASFDRTWRKYAALDSFELCEITRPQGGAWATARAKCAPVLADVNIANERFSE